MKSDILTVLTTEDRNEMKQAIKEMCLDQIREDIKSIYLIDAHDIRELHQELLSELKEEIKKELKEEYGEIIKQNILASLKS